MTSVRSKDDVPSLDAVLGFRTRIVAELRSLNSQLPPEQCLRRNEMLRIADDLVHTVLETPARRNSSWLGRTVRKVGRRLLHRSALRSNANAAGSRFVRARIQTPMGAVYQVMSVNRRIEASPDRTRVSCRPDDVV